MPIYRVTFQTELLVDCDEVIVPNPNISSSGWIRRGTDRGLGIDKLEWDYCPGCST